MKGKAHGQLRRGQLLTTYGPGALFDLPRHSAIIGGLDAWPPPNKLEEIVEPRLSRTLQRMTGVVLPKLYAPPAAADTPGAAPIGIGVYRFPEWFVVQEESKPGERNRSRRLVKRIALTKGRFEGNLVVATRFVAACSHGHVDDLNWRFFVHGGTPCNRQLWLDERGTSGDLGDLMVRCECGKQRSMIEASDRERKPLGLCSGRRPWLGPHSSEACNEQARLLIRTASNAYFPQVLTVLSLPERDSTIDSVVQELWDYLMIVADAYVLNALKNHPTVANRLAPFSNEDVLDAIARKKSGVIQPEKPLKQVELDAILAVPQGYGDDVPLNEDFHARRLPDQVWRHSNASASIAAVYQLHRLREVMALVGFTRFEAIAANINGEYEQDVEPAAIASEPSWFPAVENRGEGIFVQLRAQAVEAWLTQPAVQQRIAALSAGHDQWQAKRKAQRSFPGGPYILLHTLSHLLLQSLALRCGYPMSAIRERIYADAQEQRYGILLYTGSPDSGGTLGGLVQQARAIEEHLDHALRTAMLCSNDPICAQHTADDALEGRWLLGAACHGCTLVGESSCEMRNDYLDRALVVSVLGLEARVLQGYAMNDLLLDLPSDMRAKLIAALESGYLDLTASAIGLRAALGRIDDADALASALQELHELGMSARGAAAALRAVARVTARQRKPDLVLSGLQMPGIYARDTRVVFDELLGSAERSVWLSSFVYHNGPKVFETLAQRMQQLPDLSVNLLLNIQRRWGDSTKSEHLVSAFAHTFWQKAWPGQRRPRVYYDPRSVEIEEPSVEASAKAGPSTRAVLHAKAVVVDDEALFITSANLTEAASERNIEMGVLLRDPGMALTVVSYFQRMIDTEQLRLLPGS